MICSIVAGLYTLANGSFLSTAGNFVQAFLHLRIGRVTGPHRELPSRANASHGT